MPMTHPSNDLDGDGRKVAFDLSLTRGVLLLAVAVVLALLLLTNSPLNHSNPERDSGVFLYLASRLRNGYVPYRDLWDHKPPGIYFIDAIGLILGNGSAWGVWFVEVVAIVTALSLQISLCAEIFGLASALFGSLVVLVGLALLLPGGNLTEEFALPLQCASFWLFWQSAKYPLLRLYPFGLGVTGGLAFLLKFNVIGSWLAIVIVWLLRFRRDWTIRHLTLSFVGAGSVLSAAFGYFAATGALGDVWDQTIRYNAVYAGDANWLSRLGAVRQGLQLLAPAGLSALGVAVWCLADIRLLRARGELNAVDELLLVAVVALPLEWSLACAVGRNYEHYYIALLPALAVLASSFADTLCDEGARDPNPSFAKIGGPWIILGLSLVISIIPIKRRAADLLTMRVQTARDTLVDYIYRTIDSNSAILVWGAEPSINFLSARRSPSKYFYQYALLTPGYSSLELSRQFLRELQTDPPVLIIDTSSTNDLVPPLEASRRLTWRGREGGYLSPGIGEIFEYVSGNYRQAMLVNPVGWIVYEKLAPPRLQGPE